MPGHAELPLDRTQAVPCLQERVNGGVPGPGAVGEPVPGRPWRTGRFLFRGGLRLGFGDGRDKGSQAAAMLGDGPFCGLAQVVPEVPPVRDLDGLRGAGGGAFGEERRTVTADDLNARPFGEPGRQAGRLPVRQQIDGAAGLDVDEDGAVVAALAGGVLVDADHPRRGDIGLGQRIDQPEHRAAADGQPENTGDAGTGPARKGQADRGQGGAQPLGPLTVPTCQAGYLLDEGTACAARVPAGEPTDPQLENNTSATARHISGEPQVGAMNPVRPDSADRAQGTVRDALRVNAHYLDVHVHRQHRDVRDRREQQLLQPARDLFHGPELSAQLPCPRTIFGRLRARLEGVRMSLKVATSQNLSQNPSFDSTGLLARAASRCSW